MPGLIENLPTNSGDNKLENTISFYKTPSPARFTGIGAWLLTTDHKRIGLMYMAAIIFWFVVAIILGILIRTELMSVGTTLMEAETYNALFTLHGVIMIFFFVIPAIPAIFGNFLLPMQIGTDDVFFPKLNLLSWYLYMLGGVLAIFSLFADGPPDTGWTFYVPFSVSTHTNVGLTVTAAFILGMSSMLTGLNFITTLHRMRMKGMGWMQIPLFSWSLYATAWVQLLATPVLSITLLLIIFERLFGSGMFDPNKGGDPVLYQHLFWMYSHPAVYIMILPGMGVISEIIPVFSRKSIFGYKAIVLSSMAIAVAGSLVWAHHMFTSGMSDVAVFVFSFLTFVVAIPSAIKVFSWVSTMYRGSILMTPPLFLSLCFIYLFSIGGLTGLVLGAAGTNIQVHDTHFVVAHFHFVMFGGTGFAFFAALHFWWPKFFGRLYHFKTAYVAATLTTMGFMLHYIPMFVLGMQGMPRRYYDYLSQFETGNFFAGIGAYIMAAGIFLMFINLALSFKNGEKISQDPWGGSTLEWQSPCPPPLHNFVAPPTAPGYPYDFKAVIQKANEPKGTGGGPS
ncbi:cytochrome c oxidase subunit 1 [Desulfocicer vacuolatum DSM 3385]|uniref:Cytochrome c oxidase subunit 1 n=1 Tax=Desulfocicer vacuolatum DSM 3385 TaxID=1121400 RepID=A0A1W2AH06_9BACT|nr:cbb3-type cytochrome c oxidase subunit I [Desulfocicer vacuolatum]SMC59904.1 cytochrome c oxidase subunit 1 [Desulfocicer vacuolatum DSM 3385]